jgi:hypothetical protein
MYERRWPVFHDCVGCRPGSLGIRDWRDIYRHTLDGRLRCSLEVFNREKKLGYAMCACPAEVHYEARFDAYVAMYFSASDVPPEEIPWCEGHRLRFCPRSVRGRLLDIWPGASDSCDKADPKASIFYPHRVLQGVEGLKVGDGVELQWKMQEGSPFAWWYGQLDALWFNSAGLALGTITFRHYPASSRWYRLNVLFGDSKVRHCDFGGFTGGIRAVSQTEKKQCMMFFPKQLVLL